MKKFWERLKNAWYGILPLLLLLGIPLALTAAVWLVSNWNDMPRILGNITAIGNGSLLFGVILVLFALIGLVNAFAAFMMWAKVFFNLLERKAKSLFVFWFFTIVVTFGWYALFEIIKKLP